MGLLWMVFTFLTGCSEEYEECAVEDEAQPLVTGIRLLLPEPVGAITTTASCLSIAVQSFSLMLSTGSFMIVIERFFEKKTKCAKKLLSRQDLCYSDNSTF